MGRDPLLIYERARALGLRPALLESVGPRSAFSRQTILGCAPARVVEFKDGRATVDGEPAGGLDALFAQLESGTGDGLFPMWIGFFAYEFARHLGLPAGGSMPGLPDAAFFLYEEGWEWDGGRLVSRPPSHSPLATLEMPAPAVVRAGSAVTGDLPARASAIAPVALESDFPADAFIAGVEEVQERIRAGWVYQVNLSHRFHFPTAGLDPLACYRAVRAANPSPFMGLLEGDGWAVVSGSPERLFDCRDGVVTARPIAGTRPRGDTPGDDLRLEAELRANVKEQAEHVMLVDLLRNDLSRVCEPGSVEVSEAFTVERYSHVMHLVSEVRGRVPAAGASGAAGRPALADLVAAIFPGGTITGAPKESVMREIARLEPGPRGAYTGSLGYVSGRTIDMNILIRSLTFAAGHGHLSAGGGIVIGSDPADEYLETRHKAEALLHVLGRGRGGSAPAPPVRERSWRPPPAPAPVAAAVLFVECHDSFSHNIVNYLRMAGAEVRVVDHGATPGRHVATGITHVVAGPGPGDPAGSGRLPDWVTWALAERLPFLGVCLGHQALGVALGAALERAPRPVHGEAHAVFHAGTGLFAGIPQGARFTRYHSLCLTSLPPDLEQLAQTSEGVIMAVGHARLPAWGVQFHPESMLSDHGLTLLANFLAMPAGGL